MIEFVIFVSTICSGNTVYAHVAKMNTSGNVVEQWKTPIAKDCKKTQVLAIQQYQSQIRPKK